MTYKATYTSGGAAVETRYFRSVIEAAAYYEKHPGEYDGMSAVLQRVQDMRQGKEGGNEGHVGYVGDGWEEHDTDDEKDCNHCLRYDPIDGICFNEKSDYFEYNTHGYECCDEWEEFKP